MNILKKAQGATEYLIVLAIVIIIALIVVGVMGGIPGIGGAAGTRAATSFWSEQDVAITDTAISASGTDTIIVRNNQKNAITLDDLKINGVDLASGENIGVGGSRTYTGSIAACTAGQSFSYAASISYTDSLTSGSFNITGDGNNLQGTCAS
jgi:hypothetical protein